MFYILFILCYAMEYMGEVVINYNLGGGMVMEYKRKRN
jgi:Na+-transporting methylmalonyl-CoA/oxaloacetate decarboxylase gamma subunit